MRRTLARSSAATLALVLLAVALVGTAATAVASGPTGDGPTIVLFRNVAARTNAQPAMVIVQHGYMTESDHVGSPNAFSYRWGFGAVPSGFVRSAETISYAQLQGRVVWLTDVLTANAPGCQAATGCPQLPAIQLFVTKVAAFAGVVDKPHGLVGCYVREPLKDVPYRAGGRWWTAVGDFRPMVVRGNQVLVTLTYAWADGQHVIEIDSINAAARLFSASSFHVAKGRSPAETAFGFAQHDTALAFAPKAPKVTLCP